MAKGDKAELLTFLSAFPENIRATALWLRDFVWDLYPDSNELIYDNYNALAFGWGLSDKLGDVFCSIAVYRSINFGFNKGNELTDPEKLLLGNGKVYRYVKVADLQTFPEKYIRKLLKEAHNNARAAMMIKGREQTLYGQTIVKSVSERKRRIAL